MRDRSGGCDEIQGSLPDPELKPEQATRLREPTLVEDRRVGGVPDRGGRLDAAQRTSAEVETTPCREIEGRAGRKRLRAPDLRVLTRLLALDPHLCAALERRSATGPRSEPFRGRMVHTQWEPDFRRHRRPSRAGVVRSPVTSRAADFAHSEQLQAQASNLGLIDALKPRRAIAADHRGTSDASIQRVTEAYELNLPDVPEGGDPGLKAQQPLRVQLWIGLEPPQSA